MSVELLVHCLDALEQELGHGHPVRHGLVVVQDGVEEGLLVRGPPQHEGQRLGGEVADVVRPGGGQQLLQHAVHGARAEVGADGPPEHLQQVAHTLHTPLDHIGVPETNVGSRHHIFSTFYLILKGPDIKVSRTVTRCGQNSVCKSVARAASSSSMGCRESAVPAWR